MPRELESHYLVALRSEIESHVWQWTPETLYLGGGTPSGMEPETIASLLSFVPGAWREATVEAAPGSLTPARVDAWVKGGINRVSLGVQSFVRQELARTGRKHSAETVAADVALLRDRGISNINIDLIAGLPAQTLEGWNESLDAVLKLDPTHISVYMLEVDDDSRLGSEIILGGQRYGARDVPSEDSIADFYEIADKRLRSAGIERYEISNFAHSGSESLHNLKYWKREPYVGFGADAHSFDGTTRRQNVETVQAYVERTARHETVEVESTVPDPNEEKFFVGLRLTEGVHADESDWERHGQLFERFLGGGILERTGVNGNLRLTPRGIMVSNEVFEEFLNA
jgi:oxygen-independent coproporphyrinogen-3 oxidase